MGGYLYRDKPIPSLIWRAVRQMRAFTKDPLALASLGLPKKFWNGPMLERAFLFVRRKFLDSRTAHYKERPLSVFRDGLLEEDRTDIHLQREVDLSDAWRITDPISSSSRSSVQSFIGETRKTRFFREADRCLKERLRIHKGKKVFCAFMQADPHQSKFSTEVSVSIGHPFLNVTMMKGGKYSTRSSWRRTHVAYSISIPKDWFRTVPSYRGGPGVVVKGNGFVLSAVADARGWTCRVSYPVRRNAYQRYTKLEWLPRNGV